MAPLAPSTPVTFPPRAVAAASMAPGVPVFVSSRGTYYAARLRLSSPRAPAPRRLVRRFKEVPAFQKHIQRNMSLDATCAQKTTFETIQTLSTECFIGERETDLCFVYK